MFLLLPLLLLQNGRIKGEAKKALRGVIEQYGIPVTLSANQNILLRDIEPAWREDIQARLEVRKSGLGRKEWIGACACLLCAHCTNSRTAVLLLLLFGSQRLVGHTYFPA